MRQEAFWTRWLQRGGPKRQMAPAGFMRFRARFACAALDPWQRRRGARWCGRRPGEAGDRRDRPCRGARAAKPSPALRTHRDRGTRPLGRGVCRVRDLPGDRTGPPGTRASRSSRSSSWFVRPSRVDWNVTKSGRFHRCLLGRRWGLRLPGSSLTHRLINLLACHLFGDQVALAPGSRL
jgi:hypothetical protein